MYGKSDSCPTPLYMYLLLKSHCGNDTSYSTTQVTHSLWPCRLTVYMRTLLFWEGFHSINLSLPPSLPLLLVFVSICLWVCFCPGNETGSEREGKEKQFSPLSSPPLAPAPFIFQHDPSPLIARKFNGCNYFWSTMKTGMNVHNGILHVNGMSNRNFARILQLKALKKLGWNAFTHA